MTSFKSVDDLENSFASIGGAMGTWPYRTIWYLCRWERTNQTDPDVVKALQAENIKELDKLAREAESKGMSPSTLRSRIHALQKADVDGLRQAVKEEYQREYELQTKCPYEQEGSDMACHRCPVAANSLDNLRGQL